MSSTPSLPFFGISNVTIVLFCINSRALPGRLGDKKKKKKKNKRSHGGVIRCSTLLDAMRFCTAAACILCTATEIPCRLVRTDDSVLGSRRPTNRNQVLANFLMQPVIGEVPTYLPRYLPMHEIVICYAYNLVYNIPISPDSIPLDEIVKKAWLVRKGDCFASAAMPPHLPTHADLSCRVLSNPLWEYLRWVGR